MFEKLARDIEFLTNIKLAGIADLLEKSAMRKEMKVWHKLSPASKNKILESLKPGEIRQIPGKAIGEGAEGRAFAGIGKENGTINQANDWFNTIIKKSRNIKEEIQNTSRGTKAKMDVFSNPELKSIFANNRFINPGVSVSKYMPFRLPSDLPIYDTLPRRKSFESRKNADIKAIEEFKERLNRASLNTKNIEDIEYTPTLTVNGRSGDKYVISDFSTGADKNVGYDADSNSLRIYDPIVDSYDNLMQSGLANHFKDKLRPVKEY